MDVIPFNTGVVGAYADAFICPGGGGRVDFLEQLKPLNTRKRMQAIQLEISFSIIIFYQSVKSFVFGFRKES